MSAPSKATIPLAVRWWIVVAAVALGSCAQPPAKSDTEAAARSAVVPFHREFGLIYVEIVAARGESWLALLDTGASASAVDPRRSGDLPAIDEVDVLGTTDSTRAEIVAVEGLAIGDIELPVLYATRRDLSGLLRPSSLDHPDGRAVDLILGSDALAELSLTIDFRAGALELSTIPPEDLPASVPMPLDNGIPTIESALAGVECSLRIDTGASLFDSSDVYVNIPPRLWSELQRRDPELAPSQFLRGSGLNGEEIELSVAEVAGALIGPAQIERVFVIVQPEAGYFADPEAKGFVGNNFLEKLGRVALDYPAQRLRGSPAASAP